MRDGDYRERVRTRGGVPVKGSFECTENAMRVGEVRRRLRRVIDVQHHEVSYISVFYQLQQQHHLEGTQIYVGILENCEITQTNSEAMSGKLDCGLHRNSETGL